MPLKWASDPSELIQSILFFVQPEEWGQWQLSSEMGSEAKGSWFKSQYYGLLQTGYKCRQETANSKGFILSERSLKH